MDNHKGLHVNTGSACGIQGSIFPCCLYDCNPFCCPDLPSEHWYQCWCHHSGTVMLMPMWWCHLQLGHPQGRLCQTIRSFWLTVTELYPLLYLRTFATMSVSISSSSTPATPEHVICKAKIRVPPPTYDWNVPDQMCEFKCHLDTWFWLHRIKAEECLDYLLCILGKEGFSAMDHWVQLMNPTNEIQRSSLIILRVPWMMIFTPKCAYMNLRISRRGLMNQSTNL